MAEDSYKGVRLLLIKGYGIRSAEMQFLNQDARSNEIRAYTHICSLLNELCPSAFGRVPIVALEGVSFPQFDAPCDDFSFGDRKMGAETPLAVRHRSQVHQVPQSHPQRARNPNKPLTIDSVRNLLKRLR